MEQQIKEMTLSISDYEDKKQQLENDLKASIDKIFVLREIIAELEKQVETKSAHENSLNDKIKVNQQHLMGYKRIVRLTRFFSCVFILNSHSKRMPTLSHIPTNHCTMKWKV